MKKSILAAALCAGSLLASATCALADGMEAAPAHSRSTIVITKERGVTVYRAPRALLGDAARPAKASPAAMQTVVTKTIVEHHYHSRIAHLRAQGFYSGHPGRSRRFMQGFYSGPVDKGRSSHCAHG